MLAMEEQVAVLNSGISTVALAGDRVAGFLGLSARAPSGSPEERWVDMAIAATTADNSRPGQAMALMLEAARPLLGAHDVTGLICLTNSEWLQRALAEIGFKEEDRVLSFVRSPHLPAPAIRPVAQLRAIRPGDADTVLALNAAAFAPIWHYSPATMLNWILTADHAVLAEMDERPGGFALTTAPNARGHAQLIRVATHPEAQCQGIGRQLVADAVRYALDEEGASLWLNTQASNALARHLYEALDFHLVPGELSVLVLRV